MENYPHSLDGSFWSMIVTEAVWAVPLGVGFFFLLTWLLKYLWNTTVPEVFGTKSLTYWQTFRLLLICVLLFKG